jgi:hypothetical protein
MYVRDLLNMESNIISETEILETLPQRTKWIQQWYILKNNKEAWL